MGTEFLNSDGETGRLTKLIVVFRNFSEEPKIENVASNIHLYIHTYTMRSKSSECLGRFVNTFTQADIGAYRTARSKGQIARLFFPPRCKSNRLTEFVRA